MRDSFLKSLKTKAGQGPKRNYLYGNHLQFLVKCCKKENTEDSLSNQESINHLDNHINNVLDPLNTYYVSLPDVSTNYEDNDLSKPKRIKKITTTSRKFDNIEMHILEELKNIKTGNPQLPMSDNEKFFQSFIPYLKDMTEGEKIELQMDILNSLKKIKENRPQNHPVRTVH